MADLVEVLLAMRGVAAFVADADKAAASVGKVGTASEAAGAKASASAKRFQHMGLVGGAMLFGAAKLADSAIHATSGLAASSLQLHRVTGMNIEQSSEFSSLLAERNVSVTQAQVGFVTLSKQMEKARLESRLTAQGIGQTSSASAKAAATFAQMGISQQELTKGNTEQVLLKVSDALRQNHDAASRLVAVQTLFGRTGRNLLPVLMAGSAGIHKLLDEQKATGNYLSGKGYAAAHAMVIEQRALSREWEGAKVQLGQSLLPAMLKFVQALGWLIKIARPATKHGQLLVFTIAALGAALLAASVATKVYVGATNLAKIATALWTAVQWTLNTAFYGFPVIWIIAAIALVIVAVYELVRHWQTVVHALDVAWHAIVHGAEWVWNWLKKNWPLVLAIITGPLGLLVYEIVTHWKQIEHFVLGVVHSIEHAIERLVGLIKSIPSKLGHGLLGLASHIPGFGLAKSIGGSILGAFAAGGTASSSGPYLVGEQGAEIVTLPRGAVVSPISLPQLAAATGQGGSPLQLTIPLIVDGRELARAIARVTSDQLARR